jgi:hypothetical protein
MLANVPLSAAREGHRSGVSAALPGALARFPWPRMDTLRVTTLPVLAPRSCESDDGRQRPEREEKQLANVRTTRVLMGCARQETDPDTNGDRHRDPDDPAGAVKLRTKKLHAQALPRLGPRCADLVHIVEREPAFSRGIKTGINGLAWRHGDDSEARRE